MLRCCYAVVIVLLFASCRTKQEVVTSELEMTTWQSRLEARVDSMVRTMVVVFDSLVVTELAPVASASTPATPMRQLAARGAVVVVEDSQISRQLFGAHRVDTTRFVSERSEHSAPSGSGGAHGIYIIVVILIIIILCRSR